MFLDKTLFALTCCFLLLSSQLVAAEPVFTPSSSQKSLRDQAIGGVINRIDKETGQMVISDMTFSYSPLTLVVHSNERTSGITALRPNQKIHFISGLRKPGSTVGAARTVTEIWVD